MIERARQTVLWVALAIICVGCAQDVVIGYADEEIVLPEITWLSGAHAGNELQDYSDFAAWRGRPLSVANLFPDRVGGWDGLVAPAWPVDVMQDFPGRLILSEPLYPEGEGNNQDCAAGMYDVQWQALGTFLIERGRGDSIIRLGWGFNDADHPWRADTDVTDWVACYRRVAQAIRSTAPDMELDWSFNEHGPPEAVAVDPYSAYPGDDVVDYVGMELFDHYAPITDEAAWIERCEGISGLCSLFDFARAHGKRVGIAEWGVVSCGAQAGGDNPFFVQRAVEAFAEHADLMAYEAYFEDGGLELCSVISDGTTFPNAAARYRLLYQER